MAAEPSTLSWVFFAFSIFGAIATWNAFAPARYTSWLFTPSFFASWLTIELPLHHLAWQALAAAVFIGFGVLDSWPGWVGLLITIVSWCGLVVLYVEARRTGPILDSKLNDVAPPTKQHRVPHLHVVLPFAYQFRRRGVKITRDVPYREVDGVTLRLDVAASSNVTTTRPILIQIHGGSWVMGDKREQGWPLMLHMAANGWACFNVNYRLSPRATFPDHLIDVKYAIGWIREHAHELGADASFVAVTGGSAGGHLTSMLALTQNDPEYQPGFEDADTSVQAAVPLYGIYDFMNRLGTKRPSSWLRRVEHHVFKASRKLHPEKFRQGSPIDRIHEDAPPFLIIHGSRDTHAPVEEARHFAELLGKRSRAPAIFVELPGAQHVFDLFNTPRTRRTVEGICRFLSAMRAASGPVRSLEDAAERETRAAPHDRW